MLQGNFKSSFRDQSSFKTVLNIVLGITSPMLVLHGAVLAYSGRENIGKDDTSTEITHYLAGTVYIWLGCLLGEDDTFHFLIFGLSPNNPI